MAGVLWLERQTLEPKFLEFNYTRLRESSAGGHVEFARLSSGPWIVAHWWIRTPRLDTARPRVFRRPPPRLIGYRESGGMVTTIRSAAGAVEYSGEEAILEGMVVDSSRGITGPFEGDYGVSFRHPRLDSLGITADEQRVILARRVRQTLTLYVPPESVVTRRLCPEGLRPDHRVIVGVARDSTFAEVPRARVYTQLTGEEAKRSGTADRAGRFVICDVPAGPLTILATGSAGSGAAVVEFKGGGVWAEGKQFHPVAGRVWKQDIQLRR